MKKKLNATLPRASPTMPADTAEKETARGMRLSEVFARPRKQACDTLGFMMFVFMASGAFGGSWQMPAPAYT